LAQAVRRSQIVQVLALQVIQVLILFSQQLHRQAAAVEALI
jgi:hypothetical protein